MYTVDTISNIITVVKHTGQSAFISRSCTLETKFLMTVVYLVIVYMIVYIIVYMIVYYDIFIKCLKCLYYSCILYNYEPRPSTAQYNNRSEHKVV